MGRRWIVTMLTDSAEWRRRNNLVNLKVIQSGNNSLIKRCLSYDIIFETVLILLIPPDFF